MTADPTKITGIPRTYSAYAAGTTPNDSVIETATKKTKLSETQTQSSIASMAQSEKPLPAFLLRSDKELQTEFEMLENGMLFGAEAKELPEYSIGQKEKNLFLNRYANIFANNETRVILADREEGEDYINANYCLGRTVIVAQGPYRNILAEVNTERDFFHMVWTNQCSAIAMVTDYKENGQEKCSAYIGQRNHFYHTTGEYGNYAVLREENSGVKTSNVTLIKQQNKDCEFQHPKHYHVLGWNDSATTLPETLAHLVKLLAQEKMPVIHCSAGVGRSGTVAAVLGAYKSGRSLFEEVQALRKERRGCIQTPSQYILAHKALKILLEQKSRQT
jgi:protein tyrosine phosphatase